MQFMLNVAQTSGIGRRHVRKVRTCMLLRYIHEIMWLACAPPAPTLQLHTYTCTHIHSSCYTFVAQRRSTVSRGTCTLWGTTWRPSRIFARSTPRTPPGCLCTSTTRWHWGWSISWRLVMRLLPRGLATGRLSAIPRKVMEQEKHVCTMYILRVKALKNANTTVDYFISLSYII